MDSIVEQVERLAKSLLLSEGMELVDITYGHKQGRWVLSLFVDKEGGIGTEDCVAISREFGDVLDVKDIMPDSYSLLVSSPGPDRPLKQKEDFNRFKKQKVRIKTNSLLEGRKSFKGVLLGYEDEMVRVQEGDKIHTIPYNSIATARLDM
ncbi:MAG: ribosome maturation factor RimP [Desulfobacteria bacterium]